LVVETRYKRSDQQTVNGLTAYILGTAQSASALSVANDGAAFDWNNNVDVTDF